MIKNKDYNSLIQTQNLLDLELNELKPIFYPKLHLMEFNKLDDKQSIDQTTSSKLIKPINDKKNRQLSDYKILLDDRCIVGYVIQKNYIIDENIFKQIKLRFFKEIRYSGKNYYKRLFNVLLEQSIKTGKTIIIDKNINLERIGENTKWKIDFTNYLTDNCRSSYEWLNHMTLNKLRQIGLLTLRNHLNQQMIKQKRIEINTKLQKEVQYHIEKDQIAQSKKLESIKLKTTKNQTKNHFKKLSNQLKKTNLKAEELNEQNLQSILIELNCLQNYKYLNHQLIEFKDNSDKYEIEEQNNNLKLVNELNKKIKKFESTEYEDILREEQLKNIEFNDQEDDDDELTKATQNYEQKKSKNRKWPKFKRLERNFKYKFQILKLRAQSTFRRKLFDLQIKYKEIEEHQMSTDQLNVIKNLELCLPANVPYCQTGRSSLIAALKQFNWSHTQGPFVYNNRNKNFY